MVEYKWTLRKGGRKLKCPKCGQLRFVPYVAVADGVTMAGPEYGRCDREQNCGYQLYPNGKTPNDLQPVEPTPQEPLRFYPAAVRVDTDTPLFDYVCKLVGVRHACAIWQRYCIGRDGNRTVFWQISANYEVRAGKSIPYLPSGHRDKNDKYPAMWLHKAKNWRGTFHGQELQQCYFGEHLLKQWPDAKVVIVESEKTAAIMSELTPELAGWVWMAAGGSQGLKNADKNKVLAGREVWLLPDQGQYWAWATIAHEQGWHVFDVCEKVPVFSGCDVLDLLEAGVLGDELLKYAKK